VPHLIAEKALKLRRALRVQRLHRVIFLGSVALQQLDLASNASHAAQAIALALGLSQLSLLRLDGGVELLDLLVEILRFEIFAAPLHLGRLSSQPRFGLHRKQGRVRSALI
jgi:hypothetical protein